MIQNLQNLLKLNKEENLHFVRSEIFQVILSISKGLGNIVFAYFLLIEVWLETNNSNYFVAFLAENLGIIYISIYICKQVTVLKKKQIKTNK